MMRPSKRNQTQDKIWFFLLLVYIVTGYLAYDILVPDSVNTICLYAFLGYSALMIICSGKIRWTPIAIWAVIFLVLSAAAMLYSEETSFLTGTFYNLLVNITLIAIMTQMPWNTERFTTTMRVYVVASVAVVLILAVTGKLGDGSERLGEDIMGNANQLATMLMVGAVYGIWVLGVTEKKEEKVAVIIALAVIYLGLFLSGGRKYIIVPIISAFVFLANITDKKGKKHPIKYTLIICLAGLVIYQIIMNVPFFYNIIGNRFVSAFALFEDDSQADSSTIKRVQMIEAGWEHWKESPLIGHGFDSFKYYNKQYVTGRKYYSHNNFIELLHNQGVVGFITYYAFYVYLFIQAARRKIRAEYKGFVWAIILSLLFLEYFAVTYSVTQIQFMLFFTCSCLLMQENQNLPPQNGNKRV